MEKYQFIHVSWKGPTGGRKDPGYGCQRAAWMEANFLLPFKHAKNACLKGILRYTQGHPLTHALRAGALRAARYTICTDKKWMEGVIF